MASTRAPSVKATLAHDKANGEQLSKITSLIESGVVRQVVDRIFPFRATNEAMDYLATGRARGKVVINVR